MGFTGFPEAALDFYDDLEIDNTKAFWTAHKATYSSAVAEPMAALTADLAEEFGEAKLFRPYRDVRFAKDKSPYKTHQGAYVAVAPATGYYVQIGAPGVRVGGGIYDTSADRLTAIRAAIVNERSGTELERIVGELSEAGWEVGGDKLKTAPRDSTGIIRGSICCDTRRSRSCGTTDSIRSSIPPISSTAFGSTGGPPRH